MIVTQMIGISRARYKVYVDGQFAFILYKGELREFGIEEEKEISESCYQQIMTQVLPKRAKKRALNLLESRDYTSGQLREKLRQGDYPQACIDEAIDYVESYGYVDDLRYAKDFITYHLEHKSRTRIGQDLMRKGIGRDIIEAAFEELEQSGTGQDETAMIVKLLEKKKYDVRTASKQDKQRMYGFLYRKGFHTDAISRALLLDITLNSL
jgi:regulatory protein